MSADLLNAPSPEGLSDRDATRRRVLARLRHRLDARAVLTAVIVVGSVVLVLSQLAPGNLLTRTTTTGGDTGAHIWAGEVFRETLLRHGRLTGWSPSWYAGFPAFVFYFVPPFLLMALLSVVMPYVVAFKLVSVLGLVALPVVAYAFGRLARLAWPEPALLAAATLPFLFDQSYTILGGNIPSTLAGEFAYSIALATSLLFLGVVLRGLDTGRHRGWAAVLLALAVLCHVYAALLALAGGAIVVLARRELRLVRWAAPVFATGALLTAWWSVPFLARLGYTTDMGWEKDVNYREMLLPFLAKEPGGSGTPIFIGVLLLAALAAVVGVRRRRRVSSLLAIIAAVTVIGFVVVPQARLYNSRLLPLWFLCAHLLAGLGLADVARALTWPLRRRPMPARRRALAVTTTGAFAVIVLAVAVPLHLVPGWLPLPELHDGRPRLAQASEIAKSYVPDWAGENYAGYEATDAWPEYRALMDTMAGLPCGRAMVEFSESLERYGTTAALMLLPYWTNGCIDTMEGMFYESSATTPSHFLTEAMLSRTPSAPMRGLPYAGLDVERGIEDLRAMGVRYYLSFSKAVRRQAVHTLGLKVVARSGPWTVWEVEGATLVEPLDRLPAVLTNVPKSGTGWLAAAVASWTTTPVAERRLFTTSGPRSWPRVKATWVDAAPDAPIGSDLVLPTPPTSTVVPAEVTAIRSDDDSISFDVDRVGVPVLVRVSYFPNWTARGADGPWRVTPNLMVVVPTERHVSLHYGVSAVDWIGWLLTALGVAGLAWLVIRGDDTVTRPSAATTPAAIRTRRRTARPCRTRSAARPPGSS